jgi:hypothetical protein
MNAVADAIGMSQLNGLFYEGSRCIFPGVDSYLQPGFFCLHHGWDKIAQWKIPFAVCQVDAEDVIPVANRPIYSFNTRLRSPTAGSNGDVTDRHLEFLFGAFFRAQESFEAGIPIQVVTVKCPIGREADFEELNILLG